jgi:hypothetical protein
MSQMTYSTTNTGVMLVPQESDRVHTPKGLLVTRAVEMASGWIGQIIVDKAIVWESDPHEDERDAVNEATARVVEKLKALFAIQHHEED